MSAILSLFYGLFFGLPYQIIHKVYPLLAFVHPVKQTAAALLEKSCQFAQAARLQNALGLLDFLRFASRVGHSREQTLCLFAHSLTLSESDFFLTSTV